MRPVLHLVLHVLVPLGLAWTFWRPRWLAAAAVMLATWIVDLDHLLAEPLYDPNRCSLGFHPLHTLPAIAFYVAMVVLPHEGLGEAGRPGLSFRRIVRLLGIGLLIHMALDGIDCLWMRAG